MPAATGPKRLLTKCSRLTGCCAMQALCLGCGRSAAVTTAAIGPAGTACWARYMTVVEHEFTASTALLSWHMHACANNC